MWESGTEFRIRQQNVSGLAGQKDGPQQTGRTVSVSQNGRQSGTRGGGTRVVLFCATRGGLFFFFKRTTEIE